MTREKLVGRIASLIDDATSAMLTDYVVREAAVDIVDEVVANVFEAGQEMAHAVEAGLAFGLNVAVHVPLADALSKWKAVNE